MRRVANVGDDFGVAVDHGLGTPSEGLHELEVTPLRSQAIFRLIDKLALLLNVSIQKFFSQRTHKILIDYRPKMNDDRMLIGFIRITSLPVYRRKHPHSLTRS